MAQEGPGADCGNDARPFLPFGRVIRIPFSDLQQERWQDCLGPGASFSIALGDFFGRRQSRSSQRTHVRKGLGPRSLLAVVRLREKERRGQPCLHPLATSQSLAQTAKADHASSSPTYLWSRAESQGFPKERSKQSANCGRCPGGVSEHQRSRGKKAIAHEATARAVHTTPDGAPLRKRFCGRRS
jgi:hypothetical protein